jgi:hypothetical protein
MAHVHSEENNGFAMEQLCTMTISALLGVITVMLWNNKEMLNFMLADKFHIPLYAGGITLLVLVGIRAMSLVVSRKTVSNHCHDHGNHDHDNHEHGHEHEHAHGDEPAHQHTHHHHHEEESCSRGGHGHEDEHGHALEGESDIHEHGHDHGWNPIRYVLLMLPVALFFLNLPNQGFSALKSVDVELDQTKSLANSSSDLFPMTFKGLEQAAYSEDQRELLTGKLVELIGQFAPNSPRTFTLVRYKMSCCAADAIPLNVVIVAPESIKTAKPRDWVQVTGVVEFDKRKGRDEYLPVIRLRTMNDLVTIPRPSNIYAN